MKLVQNLNHTCCYNVAPVSSFLTERSRIRQKSTCPKSRQCSECVADQTNLRRYVHPAVNRQPGFRRGTRRASFSEPYAGLSRDRLFLRIKSYAWDATSSAQRKQSGAKPFPPGVKSQKSSNPEICVVRTPCHQISSDQILSKWSILDSGHDDFQRG